MLMDLMEVSSWFFYTSLELCTMLHNSRLDSCRNCWWVELRFVECGFHRINYDFVDGILSCSVVCNQFQEALVVQKRPRTCLILVDFNAFGWIVGSSWGTWGEAGRQSLCIILPKIANRLLITAFLSNCTKVLPHLLDRPHSEAKIWTACKLPPSQ